MKQKFNWLNGAIILIVGYFIVKGLLLISDTSIGLFFPSASAGEATITWTAPTTNCNGTSLTNLKHYELIYGQNRLILPLTPLSKTIFGLPPGTHWFSLAAVNTNDVRSEFVTASKTVLPAEFKTTSTTVYTFVKAEGRILVLPTAHTVPLGVACDYTQSVNGKYVIPVSAINVVGARPVTVVGDCG